MGDPPSLYRITLRFNSFPISFAHGLKFDGPRIDAFILFNCLRMHVYLDRYLHGCVPVASAIWDKLTQKKRSLSLSLVGKNMSSEREHAVPIWVHRPEWTLCAELGPRH